MLIPQELLDPPVPQTTLFPVSLAAHPHAENGRYIQARTTISGAWMRVRCELHQQLMPEFLMEGAAAVRLHVPVLFDNTLPSGLPIPLLRRAIPTRIILKDLPCYGVAFYEDNLWRYYNCETGRFSYLSQRP